MNEPTPTERQLAILKVIWDRGEATVREIYETMRESGPVVQNTVQALLRTMAEKGLVRYEQRGRTFYYRAEVEPEATKLRLLDSVLQRVYDGAIDRLVENAISLKNPSESEIARLRALVDELDKTKDSDA